MTTTKKYTVLIPEIHYAAYEVEASSEDEAREMAMADEAEMVNLEFSHILDDEDFLVTEHS